MLEYGVPERWVNVAYCFLAHVGRKLHVGILGVWRTRETSENLRDVMCLWFILFRSSISDRLFHLSPEHA